MLTMLLTDIQILGKAHGIPKTEIRDTWDPFKTNSVVCQLFFLIYIPNCQSGVNVYYIENV